MTRRRDARRSWRRVAGALAAGLLAVPALSGCGFHGLYGVSLPGSVTAHTYKVTVYFDDVLDLVPQSAVRVNDVVVGSVRSVDVTPDPAHHRYQAKVVCLIKRSVHLPANPTVVLQETSLLGEKFVEFGVPASGARGALADGATVTNAGTAYPGIEQVFGVLASVLNGGGLEKLQTINTEVTAALAGREGSVRDVLRQLDTLVSGLDVQKSTVVRAINAVDRLSATLAAQTGTIDTALRDLGPGLRVLSDNRSQLVSLLANLSHLGVVSTRIINASLDATRTDLTALQPILAALNQAGGKLPRALELLLDYPFPRNSVDGIHSDYTNLYASVDLRTACQLIASLTTVCAAAGLGGVLGGSVPPVTRPGGGVLPTTPAVPSVPAVPSLPAVPTLPSLPKVPTQLPAPTTTGGLLGLLLTGSSG